MSQIERIHFHFTGKTEFDSDEDALEKIVELKDLNFGDPFSEKDTELETEDDEGIIVSYYDSDEDNHIHFYTQEEGNIVNTTLHLKDDQIELANELLSQTLDYLEGINVDSTNVSIYFDLAFEELELPIKKGTEFNVKGLRVDKNDTKTIIQESVSMDGTHMNRSKEPDLELTNDSLGNFPNTEIEEGKDYIQRFL